uniref:Uncharacterized protein n=1 Tax=viral metagenome TaxID=1070528 RepID=A0A6C0CMN9_9ZZZZ
MNDTIYKDVLIQWIPHYRRAILQKKDWWILPIKRITYDSSYCALIVDIWLHGGVPCEPRYCICHYFSIKDKASLCRDYLDFYPFEKTLLYHNISY